MADGTLTDVGMVFFLLVLDVLVVVEVATIRREDQHASETIGGGRTRRCR